MYWLCGAYTISIGLILLIFVTQKIFVNNKGKIIKRCYNPILTFIYICPLTYVAACRYKFWDTGDYRLMYIAVGESFENVFNNITGHVEKGYLLFTALLNKISNNSQFLIIVSSVFTLFIICYFLYKESPNLPISFLIFSSQVWMTTMNGLRQYMVVAMLCLAWIKWTKRKKQSKKENFIFTLSILLMATFHRSVLICVPMFFLARGKLLNKKVMICIGVAALMVLFPPMYNLFFGVLLGGTEYENYVDTDATMGIFRFIISCFPVILIWIYYHIQLKNKNINLNKKEIWMMNLSCLGFACNILALKMIYFARIGIYFSIFDLITIPYCIEKCFVEKSKNFIIILLFIFYACFFYVQLIAYGGYAINFQLFYEVK